MQIFDEFMRELQKNRIDISSRTYRKTQRNGIGINPRSTQDFVPLPPEKTKTKFKGFVNDVIVIISDFKENANFGYDDLLGALDGEHW